MLISYIYMVLPSEKISKVGTSGRQEWKWRKGTAREEGFVVVEGEGKEDHMAIFPLSAISLAEKKKLKRGSLFLRECSKSLGADCQRWRDLSPFGSSGKQHRIEQRVGFSQNLP